MYDTEKFTLLAVHTHDGVARSLFRADLRGRFREYVTYSSEGPEYTHVFRDIFHGLDELHVPEDDLLRGLAIATNGAAAQPHLDYFREALAEIQGKYDIRTGRRSA